MRFNTCTVMYKINTAIHNTTCFCLICNVCLGQGQDVGVLCHTTPDELCEQIYQESKTIRPAAISLGRRCGAQQVRPEAGCAWTGTVYWMCYFF